MGAKVRNRVVVLLLASSAIAGWHVAGSTGFAQEEKKAKEEKKKDKPAIDPSGFRTVENAITAKIEPSRGAARPSQPGYLGVNVKLDDGKLVVDDVAAGSPAEKAGLKNGDVLVKYDDTPLTSEEGLRRAIHGTPPDGEVTLSILRDGKPVDLKAKLAATSRPLQRGSRRGRQQRGVLGVRVEPSEKPKGTRLTDVFNGSAAAKAGLKVGDVIVKFEDTDVSDNSSLVLRLLRTKPGDKVTLLVHRDDKEQKIEVELGGSSGRGPRPQPGQRTPREGVYRLAVVAVEYPDQKHNDDIKIKDWEDSLFSKLSYSKQSVTGQRVFGSVNDYYRELSCGEFSVQGKVFDWVEVSKKRDSYLQGNRSALLVEALDKLLERDGEEALKDFDGIFFLYAGGRVRTARGGLYWPHRASFTHKRKRWGYFIVPEGGRRMSNISVICHEFGHMLGLPDLYSRDAATEGVSVWCSMSNQLGSGRPQHFSAWCKERLGWLKPTVIDPTVKQKLILGPVEGSKRECFKVLVRRDGSEYLLLENRRRIGFDANLPGEGLLIWRVVNGRPVVEESHGIQGPAGPGSFRDVVPYPSRSNNAFTPYTTPSSKSKLGGGLGVHITNIRELPDGRMTFYIGYEYQ